MPGIRVEPVEYLRAIETALHHAEQSGAEKRRDLLDYVRHLILEKMNEPSLGEVMDAFPDTSPGDLALIRLIEFHKSRDDHTMAERDIRAFLQRFPDHPYARTATALLQTVTAGIKAHRHVIAATLPFSGKMKHFGTETFNGIRLALEEDEALGKFQRRRPGGQRQCPSDNPTPSRCVTTARRI